MAHKNFERQLAALDELRHGGSSPATVEALRKALGDRNNYIVAKAARVAAELGCESLVADLAAAFDRFFVNPVKSDPQCWAKNALVQALGDLGYDDPAVFVRGLRYVQMEPVWGGQEDTAGALRGGCALALVSCRGLSDFAVLSYLIEVLVDRDKTVRVEAARAIGRMNRPEAALLLRLRALTGDPEPEVLGACFSALLEIEGREGMPFVGQFLEEGGDAATEAALAIGLMRGPEAFQFLKERWEKESTPAALLSGMALTRESEALEFLIGLVETDSASAAAAIAALASAGLPDIRARIEAAVERSGNARLRPEIEKHFKPRG